jgi:hypothetical protein
MVSLAPVPAALRKLFWDANIETLDTEKHKVYIIERVLEFGDRKLTAGCLTHMPTGILSLLRKAAAGFHVRQQR